MREIVKTHLTEMREESIRIDGSVQVLQQFSREFLRRLLDLRGTNLDEEVARIDEPTVAR